MNLVEDGFAGWVDGLRAGAPGVALRPQKLEVTLDRTLQFSPDLCGRVSGRATQHLGVVETFGRVDEEAQHQRDYGSHHAHAHPYDLSGFGTDVVCTQKTLDKQAEKSASEGTCEDKKTDVDRMHSDWVVTSEGISNRNSQEIT